MTLRRRGSVPAYVRAGADCCRQASLTVSLCVAPKAVFKASGPWPDTTTKTLRINPPHELSERMRGSPVFPPAMMPCARARRRRLPTPGNTPLRGRTGSAHRRRGAHPAAPHMRQGCSTRVRCGSANRPPLRLLSSRARVEAQQRNRLSGACRRDETRFSRREVGLYAGTQLRRRPRSGCRACVSARASLAARRTFSSESSTAAATSAQ